MKIEVSKIEIKIGEITINLTPDQLRGLRDTLDNLLPKEIVTIPSIPFIIERHIVTPQVPYVETYNPWWLTTVTCTHDNIGLVSINAC